MLSTSGVHARNRKCIQLTACIQTESTVPGVSLRFQPLCIKCIQLTYIHHNQFNRPALIIYYCIQLYLHDCIDHTSDTFAFIVRLASMHVLILIVSNPQALILSASDLFAGIIMVTTHLHSSWMCPTYMFLWILIAPGLLTGLLSASWLLALILNASSLLACTLGTSYLHVCILSTSNLLAFTLTGRNSSVLLLIASNLSAFILNAFSLHIFVAVFPIDLHLLSVHSTKQCVCLTAVSLLVLRRRLIVLLALLVLVLCLYIVLDHCRVACSHDQSDIA